MRPTPPRTLAITDRRLLSPGPGESEQAFEGWLEALGARGVEAVQVREKDWPDRRCFERLRAAVDRRGRGGPESVLINGRADLALAAGADGIHLPATEPAVDRLRRLPGADRLLIGRSTHRVEEVERARDEGADYVTFGPVFETPSKAAYGSPLGLDGLAEAVAVGIPVLALGGLTPERVTSVASAGAFGVAAIRSFHDPTVLDELMAACAEAWPAGPRHGVGADGGSAAMTETLA